MKVKAFKLIGKIFLFIILTVLSFFYSLMFGYYLNGYLHGGQLMGIPFFILFALLLFFTIFKKKLIKYFIGPTIIYAISIIAYTEYAEMLKNRLGSNWHEYMFTKNNADLILIKLIVAALVLILVYELIILKYPNGRKYF